MPLSNTTLLLAFIVCLFGGLFTWFAADPFRSQLLSDSHRLVREMAMRYLHGMVILTTIFAIGAVGSFGLLITNIVRGSTEAEQTTSTPTATATATNLPDGLLPTITPLPTARPALPTATLIAPEVDPTLAAAQTAIVGGTNGLGVNLRDAPGLESNVIGIIPDGMPVTLLGETEFLDGLTWVAVISPNGDRGWVTDLFLVFEP